ncbi:hypothetical protein E4U09_000740 [Claviceps aff. purpurea]|uniref:TauD/TfdA-like domain-containing protein n=1 Tax=Claviceps aff. purpurea TaxID=1967640 RepID=A0A9P7QIH1_9HYPO|nr:hypothetical protein E4U09_000740 [Claviceps aff. purpurea]
MAASFGPVCGPRVAASQEPTFWTALNEVSRLPKDFPSSLESDLAWDVTRFKSDSDYIVDLTEEHLREIDVALEEFKELGLDGDLVRRNNFQLPTLEGDLNHLQNEIHNGKGFGLIRGLEPQKYSVEDLTTIYLGLQSYIADLQGRQDKKGNMLVHIIADNSTKMRASHHRHSTSPITFHNEEAGDVVSWLTRSTAAAGGKCIIASSYAIYNALIASRPDLVRVLARSDWPFALAALLGSASHPRPANLPQLTSLQLEALDAIEAIAKATQLEIETRAGDIHLINNLAILHRREGFVDGSSSMEKRHLVRMRLRDTEKGWDIPPELLQEWTQAFFLPKLSRIWHVEPMPDGYFPLRSQSN